MEDQRLTERISYDLDFDRIQNIYRVDPDFGLDALPTLIYTFLMLIDLHSHTAPRSSCSQLRPADLIQRAKEMGLDGICFTEHDAVWPAEDAERLGRQFGFLVLRGMEVNTSIGHVLVYGLENYSSSMWDIWQLKEMVDEVEGAMVYAHPMRIPLPALPTDDLSNLFDALELFNGGDGAWGITKIESLAASHGLSCTGGSDAHSYREIGRCATLFEDDIRNERDLILAIRSGNYKPKWLNEDD